MAGDPHSQLIVVAPDVRQFRTILHWEHRFGPAHCLARLHLPGPPDVPVAIVSEIRSNPGERGIGSHFPVVADALLSALPAEVTVRPSEVVWVAHFGEFSSYEALDAPDNYLRILLAWDGEHYGGDVSGHLVMGRTEVDDVIGHIGLAPVAEVLQELGWGC